MAYKAILTKITNLEPHPNADRLLLTSLMGYCVVVGLNSKVGDRVILFPPDGQLSEIYAEKNDLVRYTDPETGEKKGGMFEKNRRIRIARIRSYKSEAYVASIDSLSFTGVDLNSLEDGLEFDEIGGFKICNKYFTPATLKMISQNKQRKENVHFKKHIDTSQYKNHKGDIKTNAIVYITAKLHGTSARGGYILDTKKIPLTRTQIVYNKLFGKFMAPIPEKEKTDFDYLLGTRNVVLNTNNIDKGFYAKSGSSENFRFKAFETFKDLLVKGEIVYSELVGFVEKGKSIMPFVDTSKSENKELKKLYGSKMMYVYGCEDGQCDQYVYRITRTSDDGNVVELPYYQMVNRAKELGLKTPPLMRDAFVFDGNFDELDKIVESLTEGPDIIDPSHIREGVVIRAENPDGKTVFLKNKSFDFLLFEGVIKSDDRYVDLEEVS